MRLLNPLRLKSDKAGIVLGSHIISGSFLLFMYLGYLSFHKTGLVRTPDSIGFWGLYYWHLGYHFGYVKRSLMGAVFQALHPDNTQQINMLVLFISSLAFYFFTALMACLFLKRIVSLKNLESRMLLWSCALLFFVSPVVSLPGHTIGFMDVFIFSFYILALTFYRNGFFVAGTLLAAIAPLIHEGFIFLWGGACFVLLVDYGRTPKADRSLKPLILALFPLLIGVASVLASNHSAAVKVLSLLPAEESAKEVLKNEQFGYSASQTLGLNLYYMSVYKRHLAILFMLMALPGFLWAMQAVLLAKSGRWLAGLRVVGPIFITASIVCCGYDWSRFLSWTGLVAALPLLFPYFPVGRGQAQLEGSDYGGASRGMGYARLAASAAILAAFAFYLMAPSLWMQQRHWEITKPANLPYFKQSWPDRVVSNIVTRPD